MTWHGKFYDSYAMGLLASPDIYGGLTFYPSSTPGYAVCHDL